MEIVGEVVEEELEGAAEDGIRYVAKRIIELSNSPGQSGSSSSNAS